MKKPAIEKILKFTSEWEDDQNNILPDLKGLIHNLDMRTDITVEFIERPGISYSIRASHPAQKQRKLFMLADIIDDNPKARWLSVCFYKDMIQDPMEEGEEIPGGLMGEDGYCFDHEVASENNIDYILMRIDEAYCSAKEG